LNQENNMAETTDIQGIVQAVIKEFVKAEQSKAEPAYKAELVEERRKRERLEARVNELVAENERSRSKAEEAERSAAIRAELQKLGVAKIDLAYKAVKDEIGADTSEMRDFLTRFVWENPELLPARLAGGSGATAGQRISGGGAIDVDQIRPGMSEEDKERVRKEIAKVASQTLRGM
jgi:hypothetical protein